MIDKGNLLWENDRCQQGFQLIPLQKFSAPSFLELPIIGFDILYQSPFVTLFPTSNNTHLDTVMPHFFVVTYPSCLLFVTKLTE